MGSAVQCRRSPWNLTTVLTMALTLLVILGYNDALRGPIAYTSVSRSSSCNKHFRKSCPRTKPITGPSLPSRLYQVVEDPSNSIKQDDIQTTSSAVTTSTMIKPSTITMTPDILAILVIYFVQGAIGLSRLAVSYFLKDTLHVSPSVAANVASLTTLPWLFKPFYGFLSDGLPILGYRRKSYLVLGGLLGAASWLLLGVDGSASSEISWVTALIMAGSASIAISDVVADSMAVERSRDHDDGRAPVMTSTSATSIDQESSDSLPNNTRSEVVGDESAAGELQSLCWTAASAGSVLSAYFSGSLLEYMQPQTIFQINAAFPLLVAGAAFFTSEKRIVVTPDVAANDDDSSQVVSGNISTVAPSITTQLKQLWDLLRQPAILLPVLFVVLWEATPSASTAMFYFTTNELHFPPEFLGRVQLVGALASFAGVLAYRTWFRDVDIKQLVTWTTLASIPLGLSQLLLTTHVNRLLGIPDQIIALADTAVLSALGQLAFMPMLVLASSLCPPGVEGTLFASLMSIYNAAGSLSSVLGGWLTEQLGVTDTNFDNLSLLILICGLSSAFPLLFVDLLDQRKKVA